VAVVDGSAIISSANLTDDAFSRNLEIGALFSGGEIVEKLAGYFHELITTEVLLRWRP
jgi:cardiolipin synthase A/B